MLDWTTINPAVEGLIASLAFPGRTPAFVAQWSGRGRKVTHSETQTDIILSIRSIQDIGEDETRVITVDIDGTPTPVNAQLGNRRIILNIRAESHNDTDTTWAWQTIEKVRTRLRRPSSLDALSAVGLALVTFGASIPVPTVRARREWSIASLDVTLGARFCDPEDVAFNWIESVELTSQLKGEDGILMPSPPNYTDFLIES